MSNNSGLGVSPLGSGAYGFGTPATVPTPGGLVNRTTNGTQLGSLSLSLEYATKGQYVFDAFGRRVGAPDVNHMVILALLTVRGSSCVTDMGQRFFEVDKVNEGVGQELRQRVEEALRSLVERGLVQIDSIVSEPAMGRPGTTRVLLTDLTTNLPIDIAV